VDAVNAIVSHSRSASYTYAQGRVAYVLQTRPA
jgi:hypothetical protein